MPCEWKFIHIGFSSDRVMIDGYNVWEHEWLDMDEEPITVPHPSYPEQPHRMDIYKLNIPGNPALFGAREFSNGVWGFYVPAGA